MGTSRLTMQRQLNKPKSMIVAGVMSGTSADGVDVALCRIRLGADGGPKLKLLGHAAFPYPAAVRRAVLAAMDAPAISLAEVSRLHWRLGALYADCIAKAAEQIGFKIAKLDLAGCHGQTIYHQATPARYLGAPVRATWQLGEASLIAERLRVPVVSDFRPADLTAGGQGAPLVPMLDYALFRSAKANRVLQNLGGIANLTAIPAGYDQAGDADSVLAFDTGPANMIVDACMTRLYGKKMDRDGRVAARGHVLQPVVDTLLSDPYFAAAPPKSCGREQFGEDYTTRFLSLCQAAGATNPDIVATATALTAASILDSYRRFVWTHLGRQAPLSPTEFLVAGGGAKNPTLMRMLADGLTPLGVRVRATDELGIPAQAKEAVAFALLAWLTWHRLPGNLPSATGASRPVILGKVTYA